LEEEEKKILDNLAEAEDELAQQNQLVKGLISDLECRSQWSTTELLEVGRIS
jgi:tripartite motif-containing protein 6/22/34